MTDSRTAALKYAHEQEARFLADFEEFLRIPSISTDSNFKAEVERAAEWTAAHLRKIGFRHVQILPSARHPVVYGDWLDAGANAPTVLVYGHYDVQPADPLEKWEAGAFEPTIRGEHLYARGASDMKGQVTATLNALEAILSTGKLPINVKLLIEGEEELGSPSLRAFIAEHKELLTATFSLNPDAGQIINGIPAIGYALRGLCYYELRLYGPAHDLHSGMFGGAVHNPGQVLCELIAGMHDASGRVTLPGFYDDVLPLDAEEREALARQPFDDAYYQREAGVNTLWGEPGFTAHERVGARPTLEVNGLYSGFIGEGSKTVLPAYAMAKISMRLVANQTPKQIETQLIHYLETHMPSTMRWELQDLTSAYPATADRHSPEVQALKNALQNIWQTEPIFTRSGGSVPVVAELREQLNMNSVLTGFSQSDDAIHAPNERIHLPTWRKGTDALIHFFLNLPAA